MNLAVFGTNAIVVLGMMTILWLVSVRMNDASIVDPWWSMGFLAIAVNTVMLTGWSAQKVILLLMVALWAVRLWLHLLARSIGKPEDPRYVAFRLRFGEQRYWWVSFFQVFLLQGTLMLIISAPIQFAAVQPANNFQFLWHVPGILIFLAGFACEIAADEQLRRFRNNPANRGKVLDTGVWAWSRHPNYFGEALLWWGLWIFTLPWGGAMLTIFSPILMTFLLRRVSGVSMLDAHMMATKPGFADYMAKTPAFIPRPTR